MVSTAERLGWLFAAILLVSLAIPWFLWGDSRTAFGLPLWLWWHVAWMGLASVVFWAFTRRAWGIGVTDVRGSRAGGDETATDVPDGDVSGTAGGERA